MAKQPSVPIVKPPLPPSEHRSGPKHPVALPGHGPSTPLPSADRLKRLRQVRARKWEKLVDELSPQEREYLASLRTESDEVQVKPWILIEVPDGEYPVVYEFAEQDEFVLQLRAIVEAGRSRVFLCHGERLQISVGPLRHLLIPGHDPVPLFDLPETLLADDSGFVGDPADEPGSLTFESPRDTPPIGDVDDGLDEVDVGGEESPADWGDEDDDEP